MCRQLMSVCVDYKRKFEMTKIFKFHAPARDLHTSDSYAIRHLLFFIATASLIGLCLIPRSEFGGRYPYLLFEQSCKVLRVFKT